VASRASSCSSNVAQHPAAVVIRYERQTFHIQLSVEHSFPPQVNDLGQNICTALAVVHGAELPTPTASKPRVIHWLTSTRRHCITRDESARCGAALRRRP